MKQREIYSYNLSGGNRMKKFMLLNALLCLPMFVFTMDDQNQKLFLVVARNDSGKEVGKYEYHFELAQNIPLMREYMNSGTTTVNYSYTSQKNLENFYHYALQRDEFRKRPVDGEGHIVEHNDIKEGQKKILSELPAGELTHLTSMVWQMYQEDVGAGILDAWQATVAKEVNEGKGKPAFLLTYFPNQEKLGNLIFDHCWEKRGLTVTVHQSAIERSQLSQQKPEITVFHQEELKEKPLSTVAKIQAFFKSYQTPILSFSCFAAFLCVYKLFERQGLLSF